MEKTLTAEADGQLAEQVAAQREAFNLACNEAYDRATDGGRVARTPMSVLMHVSDASLQKWLNGTRDWPIRGAIKLAVVAQQDLIPMLYYTGS